MAESRENTNQEYDLIREAVRISVPARKRAIVLNALNRLLARLRAAEEVAKRHEDAKHRAIEAFGDLERRAIAAEERAERAETILRKAQAPRRPDGTHNYSREAFEQMANDYFAARAALGFPGGNETRSDPTP